jgi:hypothetical protein
MLVRTLKVVSFVLALSLNLLAGESPFTGTWRLKLSKSKMIPAPQGEIVRVDADDKGIKVTDDVTESESRLNRVSYEAKFDGKDYPAKGSHGFDSVSFRRVKINKIKANTKKAGKVVGDYTMVVSNDGKTTTVKYHETTPEGTIKGSAVYDKQ